VPSPSRRISIALARYPNLSVLYQSKAVLALFTTIRASATGHAAFSAAADRLLRLLAEEGLAEVRGCRHVSVATPCGAFEGLQLPSGGELAVVSIVRAGDALQEAVRQIAPSAALGKILIQRDEEAPGKPPRLYFVKLPPSTHLRKVVLVDPMLATGQSAIMAIGELLKRGVAEENITFISVVACPEGLEALFRRYPGVKVFTGAVDVGLNENRYIVPGLGDFGGEEGRRGGCAGEGCHSTTAHLLLPTPPPTPLHIFCGVQTGTMGPPRWPSGAVHTWRRTRGTFHRH
jgi:uracil phosphoribosyltransferase